MRKEKSIGDGIHVIFRNSQGKLVKRRKKLGNELSNPNRYIDTEITKSELYELSGFNDPDIPFRHYEEYCELLGIDISFGCSYNYIDEGFREVLKKMKDSGMSIYKKMTNIFAMKKSVRNVQLMDIYFFTGKIPMVRAIDKARRYLTEAQESKEETLEESDNHLKVDEAEDLLARMKDHYNVDVFSNKNYEPSDSFIYWDNKAKAILVYLPHFTNYTVSKKELIIIFEHEYGHSQTTHMFNNDDWNIEKFKVYLIGELLGEYQDGSFPGVSFIDANAAAQAAYYHLPIELAANNNRKLDFRELIKINPRIRKYPPSNWEDWPFNKIVNLKIPANIARNWELKESGKFIPNNKQIEIIDFLISVYKVYMPENVLKVLIPTLEQAKKSLLSK